MVGTIVVVVVFVVVVVIVPEDDTAAFETGATRIVLHIITTRDIGNDAPASIHSTTRRRFGFSTDLGQRGFARRAAWRRLFRG